MNSAPTTTTAPIDSRHSTGTDLDGFTGVTVTTLADGSFTVSFDDLPAGLAAVAKAKDASWRQYLRAGGNARNKRAHGSQWSAVTKAMNVAAA